MFFLRKYFRVQEEEISWNLVRKISMKIPFETVLSSVTWWSSSIQHIGHVTYLKWTSALSLSLFSWRHYYIAIHCNLSLWMNEWYIENIEIIPNFVFFNILVLDQKKMSLVRNVFKNEKIKKKDKFSSSFLIFFVSVFLKLIK